MNKTILHLVQNAIFCCQSYQNLASNQGTYIESVGLKVSKKLRNIWIFKSDAYGLVSSVAAMTGGSVVLASASSMQTFYNYDVREINKESLGK